MSYCYNTIDIIVGVGMCAISFGGVLLFLAANGTYQTVTPQALAFEQQVSIDNGMSLLQPALGQAIVGQAIFERRANLAVAKAVGYR